MRHRYDTERHVSTPNILWHLVLFRINHILVEIVFVLDFPVDSSHLILNSALNFISIQYTDFLFLVVILLWLFPIISTTSSFLGTNGIPFV